MKRRPRPLFSAESRLKGHVSVFYSVKQLFIVKLKAERWGEKVTYRREIIVPK
jgi:hypothetical protein